MEKQRTISQNKYPTQKYKVGDIVSYDAREYVEKKCKYLSMTTR